MKFTWNNFITLCLITTGCATVTTPMGGPKDEDPPILIRSNPKHNSTNFQDKIVSLTFNEYLKLKDPKEEIIVTPSPGKETDITTKSNTVFIEPKEGWLPNTTYSIAFREGVQDITEGNPAENLRLAFSTGPIIDSLSISGNITDALTEKIPEKITVAIYQQDTFDIFKHAPVYFTKSDKEGKFRIDNIKAGEYYIYAFEDKNKNLKVESQNEKFGFLANKLSLNKNIQKVSIALIQLDTRKLKMAKPRATGDISFIKFTKNIVNYQIETEERIPSSFTTSQAEIQLLLQYTSNDSTQIHLIATDSLEQKIDTVVFVKKGTNKKLEEKLTTSITESKLDAETGTLNFKIESNKIIKSINTDSIILQIDSTKSLTFNQNDYQWDSIRRKIELSKIIDKKLIDIKKSPTLITGKNFLQTHDNDSIKQTKKPINVLTTEQTGTLTVEINTTSTENFIIELLTSDNKPIQSVANKKKHTFPLLQPNSYKVRVILDKNKNGVWDAGNIFKREEPEKVVYYINREKKYDIPMRINWENEITVTF